MEVITAVPEPKRRLHSIRDVGDQAHTSHATTWRLIKRGVLKTVKIGRRTFVTDDSLEQLIAHGAPKVGEAA